jgi:hypothetical protein
VELGFFDRTTTYRLVLTPDSKNIRWRCETGQEWAGTDLVFHLTKCRGLLEEPTS